MSELSLDEMLKLAEKVKEWEFGRKDIEYSGFIRPGTEENEDNGVEVMLKARGNGYRIEIRYKDATISGFSAYQKKTFWRGKIKETQPGFEQLQALYNKISNTAMDKHENQYQEKTREGLKICKQALGEEK